MTFSFPSYPRMRVTFRPSHHAQSSSGILFPLTSYPTATQASRVKIPYFGGASRGGKAVFISLDPRLRKDDGRGGEARMTAGGVLRVVVFFTGGNTLTMSCPFLSGILSSLSAYPRMRVSRVMIPYFGDALRVGKAESVFPGYPACMRMTKWKKMLEAISGMMQKRSELSNI